MVLYLSPKNYVLFYIKRGPGLCYYSMSTILLLPQSSQLLLYQCLPSYWNYYSINVHLLLVYYYSFTNFRKSLSIKPSEKNINSCKKISRTSVQLTCETLLIQENIMLY